MSQDAVVDSETVSPSERGRTVLQHAGTPETLDPIQVVLKAVQQPDSPLYRRPGSRAPRPFDAQYWACWVIAIGFPLLIACLLIAA